MSRKDCCTKTQCRDQVCVEGLVCQAIVGVKDPERMQRQKLVIDLVMYLDTSVCSLKDSLDRTISYATVARQVLKYTEESKHYLLETLCHGIARLVCLEFGVPECKVRVEKPRAIPLASQAVVEITRTYSFFAEEQATVQKRLTARSTLQAGEGEVMVYLALGSNVGVSAQIFNTAMDRLKQLTGARLVATSGLYRTPPTYLVDQPPFLNAVVGLSMSLDPFALLRGIKQIEEEMGRDLTSARNSPRPIDIDILLHGEMVLDSPTLTIPHKDMHKRLFVMLPLLDVVLPTATHPVLRRTLAELKHSLLMQGAPRVPGEEDATQLCRAVPVTRGSERAWEVGRVTRTLAAVSSKAEAEKAQQDGAAGVVVTTLDAITAVLPLEALKVVFRAASLKEAVQAVGAGVDGVFLTVEQTVPGADFTALAEAVREKRCSVFIETSPGADVSAAGKLEHAVLSLQKEGLYRWQIVACPDLHSNPVANASYLKGDCSIEGVWYPRCWDLTKTTLPHTDSPCVSVLALSAIQQLADVIIVPVSGVAAVVGVAASADAVFRCAASHKDL